MSREYPVDLYELYGALSHRIHIERRGGLEHHSRPSPDDISIKLDRDEDLTAQTLLVSMRVLRRVSTLGI